MLILITHSAISMVHARSFSFTDDAVNVAFPTRSHIDRKGSASGPISGPQSADPALLLFQLRRAQSFWYQELYQSERSPLTDPTAYVWQMCFEMREWGESLPSTLPSGLRRMFEQELRYSYVYCIAPSARAPQITDYSRTLIFEYSLAYLDVMHEISHTALNSAFYTYHDALKVYFMANQFLAVLSDAEEMLLSGQSVAPPASQAGPAAAPPVPRQVGMPQLNLDRSLRCLEQVPQTLERYGDRWEDAAMLRHSFDRISENMVERLRSRKQMHDAAVGQQQQQQQQANQYPSGVPGQIQGPAAAMRIQSQQQPKEMRWVGVDVAQMMRGAPR